MSCWMKEIILDNCTKQVSLWTSAPVVDELHITTHYKDHYTWLYQEGNRHGFSTGIVPVVIVDAPPCGTCQRRIIESMSVYNPNIDPVTIFVAEEDPVVPLQTIIVEKIIQPNETRTMECICTCCAQQTFPPGDGINVYYEDIFTPTPPALVHAWVGALNFQSCLTATWDFVNNRVNVWIDMNYLETQLSSYVENTVFVMKNGDDATGEVERFDKPFLTIQAAYNAAQASWKVMLIHVYPGDYSDEKITLWSNVLPRYEINYYLEKWVIIKWIYIATYVWKSSVKWNGSLIVDQTSTWSVFAISYSTSSAYGDVYIELDDVILSDVLSWTGAVIMKLVHMTWWANFKSNRLTLNTKNVYVWWISETCQYVLLSATWVNNYINASLWTVKYLYTLDKAFSWYTIFSWASLYLHHTYFSNRYILNDVETQIWMKEYLQFITDGKVYLDNIYNEWRMKPNASSNALIVIWMNTNTHWELILNDCLWDIRDPDEVIPWNEKLIYVFDGNVYCYGMNHIMQWIHYDTSMYSTAPVWQVDCTGIYRGDKDATPWILWISTYRNAASGNIGDVKFPCWLL